MSKFIIFLTLISFISFKTFSQITLYENNASDIYPMIYIPNRVINIDSIENISKDLVENTNYVNTYFINNKEKDERFFSNIPSMKISKVSEQLYLIYLDKNFENYFLTFNSTFHGAWDLFYISDEDLIECGNAENLSKFNTHVCIREYSLLDEVVFISKMNELNNKSHFISNGLSNSWEIQNTQKGTYAIFFKVQKFYLISIFITILVVTISVIYLIYIYTLPKLKDFYFSKVRSISAIKNKQ